MRDSVPSFSRSLVVFLVYHSFLCYTVKYIIGFSPGVTSVERRTAVKQDRDLRSIIKSHQEEMTELELDIARYFYLLKRSNTLFPPSRVTELLHVSKLL